LARGNIASDDGEPELIGDAYATLQTRGRNEGCGIDSRWDSLRFHHFRRSTRHSLGCIYTMTPRDQADSAPAGVPGMLDT
jgi:hypothetical protein